MSSYLARLKQLESGKKLLYTPDPSPPKPPKDPFDPFDGTPPGVYVKKYFDNDEAKAAKPSPQTDESASDPQQNARRHKILTMGVIASPESELKRLVLLVSAHHGFTKEEYTEALEVALGDQANALTCFTSLARQAGLSP